MKALAQRFLISLAQTPAARRIVGYIIRNVPEIGGVAMEYPPKMPPAFTEVMRRYDPESGTYLNLDGSQDPIHTELPVLQLWYVLVLLIRAHNILETGIYQGFSTCHLSAALRDMGSTGKVVAIDPLKVPHLWDGSELSRYIEWLPVYSPEALPIIKDRRFDLIVIDSEHTYRTSMWELQHFEPLLRPGGYILFHDSLFHDGVGHTVSALYDLPRFEIVTFETPRRVRTPNVTAPVSMGLTIARKIADGPMITMDPGLVDTPERPPEGPVPVVRRHAAQRAGNTVVQDR